MKEKKYVGVRKKEGATTTWSYRFTIVVNGRTISKEQSGFSSAYAAHKAREEEIAQCRRDNGIDMNISLNKVYETFMETECKITRAYGTVLKYDSMYRNHIGPRFGKGKISKIRATHLQEFVAEIVSKYQSQFPHSMYNFLNVLFKYAYAKEYITHNPMDRVEPPRGCVNKPVKLLTEEEFKQLQSALSTKRVLLPYNIGLALGLRVSETYGLQWSDFQWDKNEVHINRQLKRQKGIWCIAPPKTGNSVRVIKFGEEFARYLKEVKAIQEENRAKYGEFYKSNRVLNTLVKPSVVVDINDFVNVKENGEFMTPDSNKVIGRTARELGFTDFRYHHLRHRYCTLLAENGVSPAVIKENAGHSSPRIAFEKYIHPTDREKEIACNLIDKSMEFKVNKVEETEEDI